MVIVKRFAPSFFKCHLFSHKYQENFRFHREFSCPGSACDIPYLIDRHDHDACQFLKIDAPTLHFLWTERDVS